MKGSAVRIRASAPRKGPYTRAFFVDEVIVAKRALSGDQTNLKRGQAQRTRSDSIRTLRHVAPIDDALTACRELQAFAKDNRPKKAPKHAAGLIVLWTVARSAKTYQAILHLGDPGAGGGYGEQAG